MTMEFSALTWKALASLFEAPRLREHRGRGWKDFKNLKSKMIVVKL